MISMRRATDADKDAVIAICRAINPEDYLPNMIDDAIANTLYVAEQDGRIVGCHCVDWPTPDCAFFYAMRIDPAVQGQGIGTAYCQAQVEAAVREGARHCFLTSALDNVRAHRTVEKNGFRNRGQWVIWEEQPLSALPAAPVSTAVARPARPDDLPAALALQERVGGEEMADIIPHREYPYGFSLIRETSWDLEDLVVVDGPTGLAGVMLLHTTWGEQMYIRKLEGTPAAARAFLTYARSWAAERGMEKWCISIPQRTEALLAPVNLGEQGCERWYQFQYDAT